MPDDHGHPPAAFNDAVHQPTRLAILVVLHEAGKADFGYLKRTLDLTDGILGRHLESLESNGLVELSKGFEGRRPRTWAKLTQRGKRALDDELTAMTALLRRFGR